MDLSGVLTTVRNIAVFIIYTVLMGSIVVRFIMWAIRDLLEYWQDVWKV